MKNYVSYDNAADLMVEIGDKIDEGGGGGGGKKNTWVPKEWSGLTSFKRSYIWTDGEDIYYSRDSDQYTLVDGVWTAKTWGLTSPTNGNNIWSDGNNIYYSNGDISRTTQYVLRADRVTWTYKQWKSSNSSLNLVGYRIWTDGDDIYYSNGSTNQYILDKSTDTWNVKNWGDLIPLYGERIWNYNGNTYYTISGSTYILNKSTGVWEAKTWDGFNPNDGGLIWTDGNNLYYSKTNNIYNDQYTLDESADIWVSIEWYGIQPNAGLNIWTDGENIYYSDTNPDKQFELVHSDELYFDQSVTLSTTDTTDVVFSSSDIKTTSLIEYECSKWGLIPDDIECVAGACTVTMPKVTTAETVTIRIYVR